MKRAEILSLLMDVDAELEWAEPGTPEHAKLLAAHDAVIAELDSL